MVLSAVKSWFNKPEVAEQPRAEDEVAVYEVHLPTGRHFLVSPVPHEHVFQHGLAEQAIMGEVPTRTLDFRTFKPNPAFIAFLDRFLAEYAPQCPGMMAEARRLGNGWVYIIDGRCPDPGGAVEPEDIIAAVEARAGELAPGSYRGNPKHQLVSKRGPLRLDAWLGERLVQELMRLKVE